MHNSAEYERGKAVGVKLGELLERRKVTEIVNALPFTWYGDKQHIDIGKDELLALIKGKQK